MPRSNTYETLALGGIVDLFLVQHGEAKSEAEDPARSLNNAGVEAAEKVAKWLSVSQVNVTEIRHSGKKRAEQTALIYAKYLSPTQDPVVASGLNPMDDVSRVANELREYRGSLMIVGHLPFLSRLTGLPVAEDPECEVVRFQNAGVVCLHEHDGQWAVKWMVVPNLIKGE